MTRRWLGPHGSMPVMRPCGRIPDMGPRLILQTQYIMDFIIDHLLQTLSEFFGWEAYYVFTSFQTHLLWLSSSSSTKKETPEYYFQCKWLKSKEWCFTIYVLFMIIIIKQITCFVTGRLHDMLLNEKSYKACRGWSMTKSMIYWVCNMRCGPMSGMPPRHPMHNTTSLPHMVVWGNVNIFRKSKECPSQNKILFSVFLVSFY